MAASRYDMPEGVYAIPSELLDLRSDADVDDEILNPAPIRNDKNVWFYWHQGFAAMHHYTQRNVRAWHRRLSKQGWSVRVLDRVPGSKHNVSNYLDTSSLDLFPAAYINNTVSGTYALQHQSDLVRFPLLLQYGGVYADVGLLQIGDIDRLWNTTIADPSSPYTVLSYNAGTKDEYCLTNYFLATTRANPLIQRCHLMLLALWAADGGRLSTEGMHKSPLLQGIPMNAGAPAFEADGRTYSEQEASALLSDYIIQGQAMRAVMSTTDPSTGWDGPEYTLINELTQWDGNEAFRLMSLSLPLAGQQESPDQARARNIVQQCLSRSFGFKLATGLILKVLGETLSSLWRKHDGSDNVPGTYAHWLRYAMTFWTQAQLPKPIAYNKIQPVNVGPPVASLGKVM